MAESEQEDQAIRRQQIREWLSDEHRVWFDAAVLVQADGANPDRHALAAHEARELLEKLPRKEHETSLGELTTRLQSEWQGMVDATASLRSGEWQGDIDAELAAFLRKLEDYFVTFASGWPRFLEQVRTYLSAGLPGAEESRSYRLEQRARQWKNLRDHMTQLSHHSTGAVDFAERFVEAELLFLDVAHGSLERYQRIEDMVREAEAGTGPDDD